MDMTPQTAWLLAISAVVIVGVIAFFVGRSTAGTKARIDELEDELARRRTEADAYRKEVDAHFDRTAALFVSMAGSYKELFEHLSSGYDKLSAGAGRERFQQRVDALLVGRSAVAPAAGALLAGEAVSPAGDAAPASAVAGAAEPAAAMDAAAPAGDAGSAPEAAGEAAPAADGEGVAVVEAADDLARRAEGGAQAPEAGETSPAPGSETR